MSIINLVIFFLVKALLLIHKWLPSFSLLHGRGRKIHLFLSISYKATNLISRVPASWPDPILIGSKSPYFQITSHFRGELQPMSLERGTNQSMVLHSCQMINALADVLCGCVLHYPQIGSFHSLASSCAALLMT